MQQTDLERLVKGADNRYDLWAAFLDDIGARQVAEIGVFEGAFAERLLQSCPDLQRYYLVDPWRHLDDWDKPANKDQQHFEAMYSGVLDRTAAFEDKRVVLRGTTLEVVDQIPDESLDFAYIDGDHTLRGITIDLARLYPKIRPGGWIGGDDFTRTIFQHSEEFEPTLVFPYAVYFAEAVGCPIYALPHRQFLLHREPGSPGFHRLADGYGRTTLRDQLVRRDRNRARAGARAGGPQPPQEAPSLRGRLVRAAKAARAELRGRAS